MRILLHNSFKKQYKKLPKKIQIKFSERLKIFLENNNNPLLNTHSLQGKDEPLISINITGDYRALFIRENNTIIFHKIGTQSELYS